LKIKLNKFVGVFILYLNPEVSIITYFTQKLTLKTNGNDCLFKLPPLVIFANIPPMMKEQVRSR